jgi:hypothetical protein
VDSATTIVTGRKETADAIRACVPNKVLEVDSLFIDLAEPGFNANFEPQFRIMNPKMEKVARGLRGEVICAIPPGLSCGNLLLHLAHTLKQPFYMPPCTISARTALPGRSSTRKRSTPGSSPLWQRAA